MTAADATSLVIDIGKTNIKIHVLDRSHNNLATFNKKNNVFHNSFYDAVDVEGIWTWIIKTIKICSQNFQINSLVVSGHGATGALIDTSKGEDGLVLPIMDYEWNGLESVNVEYEGIRPSFEETFSPSLPAGLNFGKQLFWQQKNFPEEFKNANAILMYPQYWSWRLTGNLSSEVSSIGCHTDLWAPSSEKFSSLVVEQSWSKLFPPFANAWDVIGTVSKDVADATGLNSSCVVHVGVHDSNASYVRYLLSKRNDEFCVISTGTWVVCMSSQESLGCLDSSKDMLANINVEGQPVPCIRFMGGREYETICSLTNCSSDQIVNDDDIKQIIVDGVMALPSFSNGNGPYGKNRSEILGIPKNGAALATIYCALMISCCLNKLNTQGDVIMDGSFLKNPILCRLVAQLCGKKNLYISNDEAGTVKGAAQLTQWSQSPTLELEKCEPYNVEGLDLYLSSWLKAIGEIK